MDTQEFLSKIKDEGIEYVDIRFTDTRGALQHVTIVSDLVDEDFLEEGFMFDGSSIAGWKSIEASDMKLMPDVSTAYVDPFYAETTICMHCSIVEPDTGESYERDPVAPLKRPKPICVPRALATTPTLAPRLSSSSLTTSNSRTKSTRYLTKLTHPTARGTPTPTMRWATWATARASKAATSR